MEIHLSSIFILISLLSSLSLYFQKGLPFYLKLFPIFLFIAFTVEIIGWQLSIQGADNVLLFSIFTAFEFEFYLYILKCIIQSDRMKRTINYLLIIYPVLVLLNCSFVQVNTFHSITYSVGCLLIVAVAIFYFFELFKLPKSLNLLREPAFWICSGLLFFYCCSFPLFGLLNYLYGVSSVIMRNIGTILMLLNVLLYSLFTIAFLCRITLRKADDNFPK